MKVSLWYSEPCAGQLTPDEGVHVERKDVTTKLDVLQGGKRYKTQCLLLRTKDDRIDISQKVNRREGGRGKEGREREREKGGREGARVFSHLQRSLHE